MMRLMGAVLAGAGLLAGQTFEVASVKAAPADRRISRAIHGGPGSTDPGSVTFRDIDLFSLAGMAFGIETYQLAAPNWLAGARFDITAKVPPGATVAQYRVMLQNLLAERFKLAVHREPKEIQGFDLVAAKGGPKIKAAEPDPKAPVDDGTLMPPATPPQPPPGYTGPMALRFRQMTMDQAAARLSGYIGQPVHNATGLDGKYDFTLQYSAAGPRPDASGSPESPATVFDAVVQQLGLRLAPKKETIEILVIDHIEKIPTEN